MSLLTFQLPDCLTVAEAIAWADDHGVRPVALIPSTERGTFTLTAEVYSLADDDQRPTCPRLRIVNGKAVLGGGK